MMAGNSIGYKGYEIKPCPAQLVESDEWTLEVRIWKHHGSHASSRSFSAANTFRTKEEAENHCIQFAREIIDGEVENCSTAGL